VEPVTVDRLALLPGLALLASVSLVSHSDASGLSTPIGILPIGLATDLVHLIATAVWVGGLLQLVVLVPALRSVAGPERWVRTLLRRASVTSAPGAVRQALATTRLFRWTVGLEAIFAVGVIAAVGVMTSLSPAQQLGASTAGTLSMGAAADDLSTDVAIAPG